MTGEWEYKLSLMEKGKYERNKFINEIKAITMLIVSTFEAQSANIERPERESSPCPDCGSAMYRYESKFKKGDHYWSCSNYKKGCKKSMDDENGKPVPKQGPIISEYKCSCGRPLIYRSGKGKKGDYKFWGCSGYPSCTKIFANNDGRPNFDI